MFAANPMRPWIILFSASYISMYFARTHLIFLCQLNKHVIMPHKTEIQFAIEPRREYISQGFALYNSDSRREKS